MTTDAPKNLSVSEFRDDWDRLVREMVYPRLAELAAEYTAEARSAASQSNRPGEIWVLEVPGRPTLCGAPEPSTGKVAIYEPRGEAARAGGPAYPLDQ